VEERRRRLQDEENVWDLCHFLLPFNLVSFVCESTATTVHEILFLDSRSKLIEIGS